MPSLQADIRRMVESLRRAEDGTPEPICYVISGDLAHIGPKFGDPWPAVEPMLVSRANYPNTILHINQIPFAASDSAYRAFMQTSQPDMLMMDSQYCHPLMFRWIKCGPKDKKLV